MKRYAIWDKQSPIITPIGEVLTAQELRERYNYYGPFEFVLESDGKTVFRDDWNKDIFFDVKDDPNYTAKHGYMPEKGPQPVWLRVVMHGQL